MAATLEHCFFCFDTLDDHFSENQKNKGNPVPNFDNSAFPLFVTWKKRENGQKRLRGCIGNFSPISLHSGLKEYALMSALNDRRFSPIAHYEMPHLVCAVSLLVEFEKANDYLDWEIGRHGIKIQFTDPIRKTDHSATFLPEVALEQAWDHDLTLEALIRKSGYRGVVSESLLESAHIVKYQSSKAVADYDEYLRWKNGSV